MTQYKSKYKLQIIQLIDKGYTNRQIWERVGCNIKLPQVTRKWWESLGEEEQDEWRERVSQSLPDAVPERQEKQPAFRTPYSQAKGRYIKSGY